MFGQATSSAAEPVVAVVVTVELKPWLGWPHLEVLPIFWNTWLWCRFIRQLTKTNPLTARTTTLLFPSDFGLPVVWGSAAGRWRIGVCFPLQKRARLIMCSCFVWSPSVPVTAQRHGVTDCTHTWCDRLHIDMVWLTAHTHGVTDYT